MIIRNKEMLPAPTVSRGPDGMIEISARSRDMNTVISLNLEEAEELKKNLEIEIEVEKKVRELYGEVQQRIGT